MMNQAPKDGDHVGNARSSADHDHELDVKLSADDKWDVMYQKLARYYEVHGHSNVPSRYPDDPALGFWGKWTGYPHKLDLLIFLSLIVVAPQQCPPSAVNSGRQWKVPTLITPHFILRENASSIASSFSSRRRIPTA